MQLSLEEVKAVFIKWNKDALINPEGYNQEIVTLENVEKYSKDQANDFVKRFNELDLQKK